MLVPVLRVLALAATVQAAVTPQDAVQDLQRGAIAALKKVKTNGTECSVPNAAVRKDW